MLIYDSLKQDHTKIKDMLAELVNIGDNDDNLRGDLIEKIRDELVPHSRAEEAILYNSLRTVEVGKDVVQHAYQEHMEAETLLRILQVKDKVDAEWKRTAQKLKKSLEHHIMEEETRVFEEARHIFTDEEAEMMGSAFVRLKSEVLSEGFMKTTWDLVVNMLPPRFTSAFKSSKTQSPQHRM